MPDIGQPRVRDHPEPRALKVRLIGSSTIKPNTATNLNPTWILRERDGWLSLSFAKAKLRCIGNEVANRLPKTDRSIRRLSGLAGELTHVLIFCVLRRVGSLPPAGKSERWSWATPSAGRSTTTPPG